MSRTSFDWGVPVPGSPGPRDVCLGRRADQLPHRRSAIPIGRRMVWPADLHVIGKDIVRFHTIYWPAFLMSADLPLPKQVFGHGFLLDRGEKMSKSLGNVVDPVELAEHFGVDALRYFLLREVSFGEDGSYCREAIVDRVNADLANSFGNLAQRSLSMIFKNLGGFFRCLEKPRMTALLDQVRQACETCRRVRPARILAGLEAGWARCLPATPISMPQRRGR